MNAVVIFITEKKDNIIYIILYIIIYKYFGDNETEHNSLILIKLFLKIDNVSEKLLTG